MRSNLKAFLCWSANQYKDCIMIDNRTYRACPHCSSGKLERVHRGFIRKYILRVSPIFKCLQCDTSFSKKAIVYKPSQQQPSWFFDRIVLLNPLLQLQNTTIWFNKVHYKALRPSATEAFQFNAVFKKYNRRKPTYLITSSKFHIFTFIDLQLGQ